MPDQRIVFTFDETSYKQLCELMRKGDFATEADAVGWALRVGLVLRRQANRGFTDLIVRNPHTGVKRQADADWLTC